MNSDRIENLILDVAKDFNNLAQPMSHDWLVRNGVSCNEIHSLSVKLGLILKGFVLAPERIRNAIIISSVAKDKTEAAILTGDF